jgi:hypothetical protein
MNFRTPVGDPDQLYRLIIRAYKDAIGSLQGIRCFKLLE